MTWTSSTRRTAVAVPEAAAWSVVAGGLDRRQWYLDAAPFVLRGALDRLVGGAGRAWPPPGRALLVEGDRAGFWAVVEAGETDGGHRLVLQAVVRAPGRVRLRTDVRPTRAGCDVEQVVTFTPSGLLGRAYLLADLPAREALLTLVHRRLLADLRPGGAP